MTRSLLLIASLILAVYIYLEYSAVDSSLTISDVGATRDTGELQAIFEREAGFAETFMIFGGNYDRALHNSFSDVSLAALGTEHASRIYDQYPDFHMCKSAGALLAQQLIRTLYLNASDETVIDILKESLALHRDRLAANGPRTCLSLMGSRIKLGSVMHKSSRTDISGDVIPRLRHMDFYLIDDAAIVDCTSLL